MILFRGLAKWIVIFLLALSSGLLVIIFLSSKPGIGAYLLRLILLAAVGLISGLTARLLFRGVHVLAAILLSMTASMIAALVIDHFYETGFQFQFLENGFRFKAPTAGDGSQFILMTLVSLLPLLIFRHAPKTIAKSPMAPKAKKERNSLSESIQPYLKSANPRNWKLWRKLKATKRSLSESIQPYLKRADPRHWKLWKKPKATKRSPARPAKVERKVLSVPRPVATKTVSHPVAVRKNTAVKPAVKKLKLPGKIFKGNSADVKLIGEEEHCCPYCLEEVVKGDGRGVAICPECGTWHHQDCWNLTGSCGVAHRNEL